MFSTSSESSRQPSPLPPHKVKQSTTHNVSILYVMVMFAFSIVFQFVMDSIAQYSRANIIVRESVGLAGKINSIYTKLERISGLSTYYLGIFSYATLVTCLFLLIHSFDGSVVMSSLISIILLLDIPLRLYIEKNPAGMYSLSLVMLSIYYINKFYVAPFLYHSLQAAFSIATIAFISPGAAIAPAVILAFELCQEYPISGSYFSPRTFFQALRLSGTTLVVLVSGVTILAAGCGFFGPPIVRLTFDRTPLLHELTSQPHNAAIAGLVLVSVLVLFVTPQRGRQRSELLCVAILVLLIAPVAGPNSPAADAAALSVLALAFAGSVLGRYSASLPVVGVGVAAAVILYLRPLQGESAEFFRLAKGGAEGVEEIYRRAYAELERCGKALGKAADSLGAWETQQYLMRILKTKGGEAYDAVTRAIEEIAEKAE